MKDECRLIKPKSNQACELRARAEKWICDHCTDPTLEAFLLDAVAMIPPKAPTEAHLATTAAMTKPNDDLRTNDNQARELVRELLRIVRGQEPGWTSIPKADIDAATARADAYLATPAGSTDDNAALYQHLLHMLGAEDHSDAARIIAEHHAVVDRRPAAPRLRFRVPGEGSVSEEDVEAPVAWRYRLTYELPAYWVLSEIDPRMGCDGFKDAEKWTVVPLYERIATPGEASSIAAWNRRASPGAMSDRDAYEGAREELLDWKGRALRAEQRLRAQGWLGINASEPPITSPADSDSRVPEGWKLVPCEATVAMVGAATDAGARFGFGHHYAKAIAAAPAPAAAPRSEPTAGKRHDGPCWRNSHSDCGC